MSSDDDAAASDASPSDDGEVTLSRREARRARRDEDRTTAAADAPERRERVGPLEFGREVRSELRKVAWPSGREVVNYSAAVLVMTAVLSLMLFGMDFVIRNLTIQLFG